MHLFTQEKWLLFKLLLLSTNQKTDLLLWLIIKDMTESQLILCLYKQNNAFPLCEGEKHLTYSTMLNKKPLMVIMTLL